ncbi:hypothetical protein LT493_25990 [Streptomyces tricolor]|nr:hypothetical protein [Streptomyces tricolor]
MPWNLPFSAIAETFFSKVMWQADMMQVALRDAQPPAHAWATASADDEAPNEDDIADASGLDLPQPGATVEYTQQYAASDDQGENMRYALVAPDGEITFGRATRRQIRRLIGADAAGETGHDFLNSLYPAGVYYYVPFAADDRPMNEAANGMYWELSAPVPSEDGDPSRTTQRTGRSSCAVPWPSSTGTPVDCLETRRNPCGKPTRRS